MLVYKAKKRTFPRRIIRRFKVTYCIQYFNKDGKWETNPDLEFKSLCDARKSYLDLATLFNKLCTAQRIVRRLEFPIEILAPGSSFPFKVWR